MPLILGLARLILRGLFLAWEYPGDSCLGCRNCPLSGFRRTRCLLNQRFSPPGCLYMFCLWWPQVSCLFTPPPHPPSSSAFTSSAGPFQLEPGNYKTLQSAAGEKQKSLAQMPEGAKAQFTRFSRVGARQEGFIHLGGAIKTKIKFFISE